MCSSDLCKVRRLFVFVYFLCTQMTVIIKDRDFPAAFVKPSPGFIVQHKCIIHKFLHLSSPFFCLYISKRVDQKPMEQPPSTINVVPVTNSDAFEARYKMCIRDRHWDQHIRQRSGKNNPAFLQPFVPEAQASC